MKQVFEFSSEETIKILYEELVRQGKVVPIGLIGIEARFTFSYGKVDSIQVLIGDPTPGAKCI